jgi:methyltransferase
VTPALIVLSLVTLQRGAELILAERNTRRLRAQGAIEVAPSHYPIIVGLHAAWLIGMWLLAREAPVRISWLAVFILLQLLRIWVIASLGGRWTTRIIVIPGAARVRRGPYRFLAHPNYLVVAGEIAVLPLAFGLPWYALAFSLANAAVLTIRIRAENAALRPIPEDARGFEREKSPYGSSSASQ